MNLSVLSRLLPGWEFRETNGVVYFRKSPIVWLSTGIQSDEDHLCAEIERALLAREDVRNIITNTQKEGFWVTVYYPNGNGYSPTPPGEAGFPTKLLALVAVAEKVLDQ